MGKRGRQTFAAYDAAKQLAQGEKGKGEIYALSVNSLSNFQLA